MGYHHKGVCVLKWELEGRWFGTALIFSCTYHGQKGYTGTNLALSMQLLSIVRHFLVLYIIQ